jgi:hypothetical protein
MLEQYTQLQKSAGVNIWLKPDGGIRISACELVLDRQALDIVHQFINLSSLKELEEKLPAKLPVALNLSGKGILMKQVGKLETVNASAFATLLPNASFEDFYVQHFPSGEQSFVALIRKVEADKWIQAIQDSGYQCLSLSLNAFPAANIVSQLNEYGEEIVFDGHRIVRNADGGWLSYQTKPEFKAPFPVKIASEKVEEQIILPYAAAFQLLLAGRIPQIQAAVPALKTALNKTRETGKLKAGGIVALVAFFILLLINFALLSYYSAANQKMAGQVSQTVQSSADLQTLMAKIHQQEDILQRMGWEKGISKSVMVDQIAQCMPAGISWQQVAINAPKPVSGQKEVEFQSRRIEIKGYSVQLLPVNEWQARLKIKPWVKEVQLEEYNYSQEMNTGQFTLTLTY